MATVCSAEKDEALALAADCLAGRSDELLVANAEDVARSVEAGASPTVVDRLRLTETSGGTDG